ncbi:class F sortase [Nocardioides sp. AE5]|uniref:class F sortase n=1 Tax=Nocardioides sp. AE5 TaxID=2962573 RepID=UPI002881EBCB|nr:class F sortase [Nocardioides sp. AE5]MDT0203089.1 class F sortase [Nocardioides sp. AE5]
MTLVASALLVAGCGHEPSAPEAPAGPATHATVVPPTSPSPTSTPAHRDLGPPTRLSIPRIDVDTTVEHLGLAEDGSQEVPHSLATVGWWREGATPGGEGNVVLVGHTASSADGVFDDLGRLRPGDRFTVTATDGSATYVVTESYEIRNEEFADHASEIYRITGAPGAVLMTCSTWNGHTYETTTVVHARRT